MGCGDLFGKWVLCRTGLDGSAHVGRQWLGRLGKTDNGIVTVTTVWTDGRVYYPLHATPYTPAHHFTRSRADPAFRTKVLAPDYQRIVSVLDSEAGHEGMRCQQLAVALGLEVVPAKVERLRAKAKRLVERGWILQVRPGVFTALAVPAG